MKKLFFLPILLFFAISASAWHDNGHMTGGAVAYYYLKAHHPATLKKVLATLKMHPWYKLPVWTDRLKNLNEEQTDVALFMLASTYPDDIKDSTDMPNGKVMRTWHYVDYPYMPAPHPDTLHPVPSPNAQEVITRLLKALPAEADGPDRAKNDCWLFHLIEDIHQPLHTVELLDSAHAKGDAGGNGTYIMVNGAPVKLHTFWDGLVKGTMADIPAHAQALLAETRYHDKNLPELTQNPGPDAWITKEGMEYAQTAVYKGGTVNGTKLKPTTVSPEYITEAQALGEKRVVLSGIRLAKLLVTVYK